MLFRKRELYRLVDYLSDDEIPEEVGTKLDLLDDLSTKAQHEGEEHEMTGEAPNGGGTKRRWLEDELEVLLDEEGGQSVDEQAFENARKAAQDVGAAVRTLEDANRRSDQKIADLCGAVFVYGALFAGVQLNHDMRRELLKRRGRPGDDECAQRLEAFHVRHVEMLADEIEDQTKVDRMRKLVRGTLDKARAVKLLGQVWK